MIHWVRVWGCWHDSVQTMHIWLAARIYIQCDQWPSPNSTMVQSFYSGGCHEHFGQFFRVTFYSLFLCFSDASFRCHARKLFVHQAPGDALSSMIFVVLSFLFCFGTHLMQMRVFIRFIGFCCCWTAAGVMHVCKPQVLKAGLAPVS